MIDSAWVPIRYWDFQDVPRAFLVRSAGALYFFDCPFDDFLDEYPDLYDVYLLTTEAGPLPEREDSSDLRRVDALVGRIPVSRVRFDQTRRAGIHESVFELLPTAG